MQERINRHLLVGLSILLLADVAAHAAHAAQPVAETERSVARSIQSTLETHLFAFSADIQRHYAERMFRMTGDEKYLPPLIGYAMTVANLLRHDATHAQDAEYRARKTAALLDGRAATCLNLGVSEERRTLLRKWGDLAFSLEVLCRLNIVRSYGLLGTPYFESRDTWLEIVGDPRIARFVVDPEVIRIYGAQATTFVYYLLDLGVRDQRAEYIAALRAAIEGSQPGSVPFDFTLRVYTLTHLVLAASRFYQEPVDRSEFAWVYDDFESNLEAILANTRPDVIAEVGICFALAGEASSPTVARLRQALIAAYRPDLGMIPAVDGTHVIEKGEHRNVLALMLLEWPEKLHPGPDLPSFDVYRKLQPPGPR
jgi:hypothetical protein